MDLLDKEFPKKKYSTQVLAKMLWSLQRELISTQMLLSRAR